MERQLCANAASAMTPKGVDGKDIVVALLSSAALMDPIKRMNRSGAARSYAAKRADQSRKEASAADVRQYGNQCAEANAKEQQSWEDN